MATWRLAKSLATLRSQIDAQYPKRSKKSDGTIGDARHAAKRSDHNKNASGVVCAMDITEDAKNGPNLNLLVTYLLKDPRCHYCIYERKIYNPSIQSGKGRPAKGHEVHLHISVHQNAKLYDDPSPWKIMPAKGTAAVPVNNPRPTAYDPQRAVKFFEGRGWSKLAACALVASLMWESGGNGKWTIVWDAKGDKDAETGEYMSHYAAQWNKKAGRLKQYEDFAASIKRGLHDPYAQLAFVQRELETTKKRAAKAMREATTLEEANDAAIMFWGPSIPHAEKRLAIARRLYNES